MPNYSYMCESCSEKWDCIMNMNDRDKPTKSPCPKCKEKKVVRDWSDNTLSISADATLTPNKATGGRWNELMSKMKAGMPKRYGRKLDSPNNMTGKRWYG